MVKIGSAKEWQKGATVSAVFPQLIQQSAEATCQLYLQSSFLWAHWSSCGCTVGEQGFSFAGLIFANRHP